MLLHSQVLTVPTAIALAVGLCVASPASALDGGPGDLLELAQAGPTSPPTGGLMHARADRTFTPKAMCQDGLARRVGNRAYIKARLELKPDQMAAWNAFEKAADDASAKERARCAALPAEMKDTPNYVDRLTMREDMMKARLASIEAVKPTLLTHYNVLSPDQKAVLDKPTRRPMVHGPGPR
jgi:hypothetical protein